MEAFFPLGTEDIGLAWLVLICLDKFKKYFFSSLYFWHCLRLCLLLSGHTCVLWQLKIVENKQEFALDFLLIIQERISGVDLEDKYIKK